MRKQSIFLIAVLLIHLASLLHVFAAPVGRPYEPPQGNAFGPEALVELEATVITQRDFKFSELNIFTRQKKEFHYQIKSNQAFIKGVIDSPLGEGIPFSIIGKVGLADLNEVKSKEGRAKGKFDPGFGWGIGVRFETYLETIMGMKIGGEIQHVAFSPADYRESSGALIALDWRERQASFYLRKQWNRLTPYIGVKYSELTIDYIVKGTTEQDVRLFRNRKGELVAKDHFGIFTGIDVIITDSISATLEGRFIDETAFSLIANYRF